MYGFFSPVCISMYHMHAVSTEASRHQILQNQSHRWLLLCPKWVSKVTVWAQLRPDSELNKSTLNSIPRNLVKPVSVCQEVTTSLLCPYRQGASSFLLKHILAQAPFQSLQRLVKLSQPFATLYAPSDNHSNSEFSFYPWGSPVWWLYWVLIAVKLVLWRSSQCS